jgi:hypothetical protein
VDHDDGIGLSLLRRNADVHVHLARHVGAAIDDGGLAADVEEAFARERVGRIVGGLSRAVCNGEHRCRCDCDHAGGITGELLQRVGVATLTFSLPCIG